VKVAGAVVKGRLVGEVVLTHTLQVQGRQQAEGWGKGSFQHMR
jgi:hypothetical protein